MASQITHEFDGIAHYSASSVGKCEMALYHSRTGQQPLDPPANILKAYDEGKENEDRIIRLLESQAAFRALSIRELADKGYQFGQYDPERGVDYSQQVRVEWSVGNSILIGAHLDGIVRLVSHPLFSPFNMGLNDEAVLEVKAFGDAYWKKYQKERLAGFRDYQWQVSTQIFGTGLPCLFVVGHKGSDGKVYEIDYEEVMVPPISRGTIAAKLLRIEKAVSKSDCNSLSCPSGYEFPCPYYQLHDNALDQTRTLYSATGQPDNAPSIEEREIDSLAEQYDEVRKQEEILGVRKSGLRDSMLALFDRINARDDAGKAKGAVVAKVKKVLGQRFVVTDVTQERPGALDEVKLKEAGVDIEQFRKPGSTSRFVRVTERKNGSEPGE